MSTATEIELSESGSRALHEDPSERDTSRIVTPENAQSALEPVSKSRQATILICAFFDVFLTIGLNQAYGVFLTYYLDESANREAFLPIDQISSKPLVALVGTVGAGLTWGGSIFVNPLMARSKDPRWITLSGAILIGISYVLASFVRNVRWQFLI